MTKRYLTGTTLKDLGVMALLALSSLYPAHAQEVAPRSNAVSETVNASTRQARSRIFNIAAPTPGALKKDSPIRFISTRATPLPMPELPTDLSDTIAVGVVESSNAFATENQGAIYTELLVRVENLISETSGAIAASQKIDGPNSVRIAVLVIGGELLTDSGKRVVHELKGGGRLPEVGKRYLFFLRSRLQSQCALPVKMWEFDEGIVKPMSEEDVRAGLDNKSPYSGMQEDVFLGLVRNLKATQNPIQ